MSIFPGPLYMMLKGSDVGWSMLLSYLCLPANNTNVKKRYTWGQVAAVGFIMAGIAMVFLLDDGSIILDDEGVDDDTEVIATVSNTTATNFITNIIPTAATSMMRAAMLCLVGAFLNAFCSVGTEAMLKKTLQQEEERLQRQLCHANEDDYSSEQPPFPQPSKLFLSNAYSMWTSFFSFVLLGIPVLWKELSFESTGSDSRANSLPLPSPSPDTLTPTLLTTANNPAVAMIGPCLVLLALSRFLERLAKYIIYLCFRFSSHILHCSGCPKMVWNMHYWHTVLSL